MYKRIINSYNLNIIKELYFQNLIISTYIIGPYISFKIYCMNDKKNIKKNIILQPTIKYMIYSSCFGFICPFFLIPKILHNFYVKYDKNNYILN